MVLSLHRLTRWSLEIVFLLLLKRVRRTKKCACAMFLKLIGCTSLKVVEEIFAVLMIF